MRFVFHLSLSFSFALSLKDTTARQALLRAHLSIFFTRAIFRERAIEREKKASGDLVEFWIQERGQKRNGQKYARALASTSRIVASLGENFNRAFPLLFLRRVLAMVHFLYSLTFFWYALLYPINRLCRTNRCAVKRARRV